MDLVKPSLKRWRYEGHKIKELTTKGTKYMQIIILCGDYSEKATGPEGFYGPMVDVEGKPLVWHAMNHYARQGFKNFILCVDFERNPIKDYFLKYETMNRDFELCLGKPGQIRFLSDLDEGGWQLTFVNTNPGSMSGTMVKSAEPYIDSETFLVTYADRVTTLDIGEFLSAHKKNGKVGSVLAAYAPAKSRRFRSRHTALEQFIEQKGLREEFISGGMFIFNRSVLKGRHFSQRNLSIEEGIASRLIRKKELSLHVHDGYWQHIDTKREATQLRNNPHILGERKKICRPSPMVGPFKAPAGAD